jgi:hypothetical protein
VINLAAMRPLVPRIDCPDPSHGTVPPAFALTSTLPSLGSEYLIMGLGAGMLGVYSLATGQLVSELYPGIPHRAWGDVDGWTGWTGGAAGGGGAAAAAVVPGFELGHYSSLAVARVGGASTAAGSGGGSSGGSNAGRTLLVAAPAGGQGVFVFDLDLEAAAVAAALAAGSSTGIRQPARST